MKVKKLIVPLTLFISFIVALSGCTTETPPRVERQQPYPYDDDFVCGYFLTFRDDDNPDWVSPFPDDFEDPEAVKVYARLEYSSPASSKGWLTVYNGLAVNTGTMQIEGDPLCPDKSGSIRLHDKIYFTREMAQKTFVLHAVMYNAAERRVYTNVIHEGFIANGSTVMWGREMTAGILEVEFKEVTYTPDFSLTFEEVGKLASLEITQYDDNDNALETLAYSPDNFNEIPYVFVYDPDGERETPAYARLNRNTAYVIIKKTYEGEQFNPNSAPTEPTSERILLNNNFNGKIEIPLPMKGLVSRHEISFNFPVFDG